MEDAPKEIEAVEEAPKPKAPAKKKAAPKVEVPLVEEPVAIVEDVTPIVEVEAPEVAAAPAPDTTKRFPAHTHVKNARKIYKKEPWLIKSALRKHNPDDMLSKDEVREILRLFLGQRIK